MQYFTIAAMAAAAVNAQIDCGPDSTDPMCRTISTAKGLVSHYTGIGHIEARAFIKDYGCYCFPRGNRSTGSKNGYNGKAVDALDEACRQLYLASKCLSIDAEEGNMGVDDTCNADNRYRWYVDASNKVVCGDEDKPSYQFTRPCNYANCELEKVFAQQVADIYADPSFSKNKAWDNLDEDEYEALCPKVKGTNPLTNLSCCGAGFNRRTYNPIAKDCCDDGSTSPVGTC